jgi:hypothetical protein
MPLDMGLDTRTATTSAPSATTNTNIKIAINAKIKIVSTSTATTPVTKITPIPKEVTGRVGQCRRQQNARKPSPLSLYPALRIS